MLDTLFQMSAQTPIGLWVILILASLGTYAWRALGVLLSGRLHEGSPMFRWVSCVTYAMVAALVVRIIVLPIGVLAQVPLSYRLAATGTALAIVWFKKEGFVPAIVTGTLLISLLSWLG